MNGKTNRYHSWGQYPKITPGQIKPVYWRDEELHLSRLENKVLPFAFGRSYGDSCLNDGGTLLEVKHLDRFIEFDEKSGILRCEAGVSLTEILRIFVPRGWFLPVVPGTKHVSIGGAIANDIHGKNHHRAGTFGSHVTALELARSCSENLICTPTQNRELFHATIGGLGLTGLILWAEFRLKRISTPFIETERIRFSTLNEFFTISAASNQGYDYTVAWIDCLPNRKSLGRGIFIRGNHMKSEQLLESPRKNDNARSSLRVPFDFPAFFLNQYSMRVFNALYYHSQFRKNARQTVHYDSFFFPLDKVEGWNRIYGRHGFFQYQCVVPPDNEKKSINEILTQIVHTGEGSFLAVLKKFGNLPSGGMLSFPRAGTTLAVDFRNRGEKTLALLEDLDRIVRQYGGAVYPAKDARMTSESFQAYFPQWRQFTEYIDPKFESGFWRRVTSV